MYDCVQFGSAERFPTLLTMGLNRNLPVIYAAALLRSLGVGLTGVILAVYLSRAHFSPTHIGIVIAAGLAGAALATLVVSLRADQLGRRRTLLGLSLFAALGGAGFSLTSQYSAVFVLAFFGMVNGMGTDRGPAFALEQAVIPQAVSPAHRTLALSWYALVLDAGHALGALGAGLPLVFKRQLQVNLMVSYKLIFVLYGVLNVLAAALYLFLSTDIEAARSATTPARGAAIISPQSKRIIGRLAALSGLDSLGGGFLPDALIAYWFFRRFGFAEGSLGPLFFTAHLLNAGSYLVAAWLARRVGLLNTMVFTHIPSNLFLMAVPLAPSPALAVALYLAREALVEMDVPTRQSYVVAVVQPGERTFASGITNLTRNVSRAIAPSFAGFLMQHLALAAPLFFGGGVKITYDLLLYVAFRHLEPPEEETPRKPAVAVVARKDR